MNISIVWETESKTVVRITDKDMSTLTVTKAEDHIARVKLPDVYLDSDEAKVMATALMLAAKVVQYLDEFGDEALDAIKGLPTTPYDGPWPTPRAGRTEN